MWKGGGEEGAYGVTRFEVFVEWESLTGGWLEWEELGRGRVAYTRMAIAVAYGQCVRGRAVFATYLSIRLRRKIVELRSRE